MLTHRDKGYYNARYYEPEDFDEYDIDGYDGFVHEYIKNAMLENKHCYPFTQINFGEYLSETGQDDKAVEDATESDKIGARQYWRNVAHQLANKAWEKDGGYVPEDYELKENEL